MTAQRYLLHATMQLLKASKNVRSVDRAEPLRRPTNRVNRKIVVVLVLHLTIPYVLKVPINVFCGTGPTDGGRNYDWKDFPPTRLEILQNASILELDSYFTKRT